MPNTPAIVNQGCSVFVRGSQATQNDADIAQSLLQSIGTSEEIVENMMDAVTGLSGSGPAYVFVMIEALADGGVKMGLYLSTQIDIVDVHCIFFSLPRETFNRSLFSVPQESNLTIDFLNLLRKKFPLHVSIHPQISSFNENL